jgi:hypothetical protein
MILEFFFLKPVYILREALLFDIDLLWGSENRE